jgi:hypothetical protein
VSGRPLIILLASLLLIGVPLRAQDVSQHAQEAVKTIQELRKIPLEKTTDPPAQVPGLLRKLNLELRDLIIAVLNDPHRDSLAEPDMVYDALKAAGWGDIYRSRWDAYGEISNIDFEWVTGHDLPLLVVDTELWMPCGSDPYSMLSVFQERGRNWELILSTEADYITAAEHPDEAMQYVVSPQDQSGKWFLGVATVFPTCRTGPDEIRFKVLRPGPSSEKPLVLVDRRVTRSDRFSEPFSITVDEDKFSVTLGKERMLDGESGISIFRFDVQGDRVLRVPPFALRPEDFLDEWVRSEWADVAPWTDKAKQADLEEWHGKLKALAYDSTEIEFVQSCAVGGQDESSWQIGLWIDQKQNHKTPDERLYFAISQKMGAYIVEGISKTRPEGCPGNTRPSILPEAKLPFW